MINVKYEAFLFLVGALLLVLYSVPLGLGTLIILFSSPWK